MTETFYPPIGEDDLWPIKQVRLQIDADPDYLTRPECPYSDEVKRFFQITFGGGRGGAGNGSGPNGLGGGAGASVRPDQGLVGLLDPESLEDEASSLYLQLQSFGQTLQAGDTAERAAYFRLSVSLLEKLTDIKKRNLDLGYVRRFTDTVIQIMEDELPPDLRTRIIDRLRDVMK